IREKVGTSSSDRAASLLSYYRLLEGEPGSLVRVGLVHGDGSPLEVVLKRHVVSIAPAVRARTLPAGYLYVRIPMFDGTIARQVSAALRKAGNVPGIVLDVRGNPGGNFAGVLKIADNF